MACEEFPDQIVFKTPLKGSEEEIDPSSACDEEKHLGEGHRVASVYTLGDLRAQPPAAQGIVAGPTPKTDPENTGYACATAPSECTYASSPCWLRSRPMLSSSRAVRSGMNVPISFNSMKLPTPL
jgi:hypothetical protein